MVEDTLTSTIWLPLIQAVLIVVGAIAGGVCLGVLLVRR